ncbi:MAG: class I SAM-dependent rRNA methyltransferase [Deltaproteobacteria bacterium]|nr:class I SAM-dependent rRNA methyltransferase [Deltaproteobacteria bacterium]
MNFIIPAEGAVARVKLTRDRTRLIKQGYPWIFKDWLSELPRLPAGSRALVRDRDGSLIAYGMYDPNSPLAVRVCAIERERLDDDFIAKRLREALRIRTALFDSQTTGYRLLNGEGDGLPGLVCDRYGRFAVLKLDGEAPTGFWNVEAIAEWLIQNAGIRSVYLKYRAEEKSRGRMIEGELPESSIPFLEQGVSFQADIQQGQKTGFFFDQRENRGRIKQLAKGKSVLNLFGYTGGFSIYAGLGGASHVTTVDIAQPAIEEACRNWELNELPQTAHSAVAEDAFEYLAKAREAKSRWDLIVVDPPSFAPSERLVEKAKESYIALFTAALRVLSDGGVVALSSCSSHISSAMFLEICGAALSAARCRASVLGIHGQPADHPFPFVCTELQYLKFVLLQVR